MTQVPQNNDQPLIQFLKRYRPIPPTTDNQVETQLMQLVTRESRLVSDKQIHLFWLIPSAIAATGLVIWLGFQGSQPSVQLATKPEELESFVVDSWNGSFEEPSYLTEPDNPEMAWLILEDSNTYQKKQD